MTKKTNIAETGVPSYLQEYEGPVNPGDDFGSDDVVIPRIALLQGQSPAVQDHADATPGNFWHTGMDCVIDDLTFVVAFRRKRYLLVAPLEDGQGILARSDDAKTWDCVGEWEVVMDKKTKRTAKWTIDNTDVHKSGLLAWGTSDPEVKDSPPAATMFYDYVVIVPERPDLGAAVISLSRSAIKKAKKGLNDKIMLHAQNGRPMQSLLFKAAVVEDTSDFGKFYNWQFTGAGFAPEGVFNQARALASELGEFKVAEETPHGDESLASEDDLAGDPAFGDGEAF